jgi:hypothetical protein
MGKFEKGGGDFSSIDPITPLPKHVGENKDYN